MNPSDTLAAKNKNPFNLRPISAAQGGPWKGEVAVSSNAHSGRFSVFESNVMGVRAGVVNMRTILRPEQLAIYSPDGTRRPAGRTLERLIYTWCPPVKDPSIGAPADNTEGYLTAVCHAAGVGRDYDMSFLATSSADDDDVETFAKILMAMNRVEAGGQTITKAEAIAGIQAALGVPKGTKRTDDGNVVIKDIKDSTIIKDSNKGIAAGGVAATAAAAAPVVTAISAMDWKVAIVVGVVVLGLAGFALLYFGRIKKARKAMHAAGVA